MMSALPFKAFLIITAMAGTLASPLASQRDYPEIIPGPGLPSLASLGVTSQQLYEKAHNHQSGKVSAPSSRVGCGPDEKYYTNVDEVIACFHYLQEIGDEACTVPAGSQSSADASAGFCATNNSRIMSALLYPSKQDESTTCGDIANSVLHIIDSCTRPDSTVAGVTQPDGNLNFLVAAVYLELASDEEPDDMMNEQSLGPVPVSVVSKLRHDLQSSNREVQPGAL